VAAFLPQSGKKQVTFKPVPSSSFDGVTTQPQACMMYTVIGVDWFISRATTNGNFYAPAGQMGFSAVTPTAFTGHCVKAVGRVLLLDLAH
jgi:hypothetical protein